MNVNELIESLNVERHVNEWEKQKQDRAMLQPLFARFTGRIDGFEPHFPFAEMHMVKEMLRQADDYNGPKILVVGGDAINLDALSHFWARSTTKSLPTEEIKYLVDFLRIVEQIYDDVIFLTTNHENRINKFLADRIGDKALADDFKKLIGGLNQTFQANDLKVRYVGDFLFKIGNVWYTHFENNSVVPGRVGEKVWMELNQSYGNDWECAFQFHTHSQSMVTYGRQTVVETGTVMYPPDYWVKSGKVRGERKSKTLGYGSCEMIDGCVDINTARYNILAYAPFL